jgi:hypothetical protein
MPTSLHGFQRLIVKGVPVWKKEDALYYYDTDVNTNPTKVGTLSGGFDANWMSICKEKLESYRSSLTVRTRRTSPKKK